MIRTIIGDNLNRDTYTLPETTTIRQALETAGLDYTGTLLMMDGATLKPGEMDKTFAEHGYDGSPDHDYCRLIAVTKRDNA